MNILSLIDRKIIIIHDIINLSTALQGLQSQEL